MDILGTNLYRKRKNFSKTTDNFPVRRSLIPTEARVSDRISFSINLAAMQEELEEQERRRVHGVLRLFLLKNYSIIKFLNRLEIIRSDGGLGSDFAVLPLSMMKNE